MIINLWWEASSALPRSRLPHNVMHLPSYYVSSHPPSFSPLAPQLRDGARSVQRTFRNNFLDSSKQLAIDKLLFSNVYGGEIGQETRALLEMDDALGMATHSHTLSPSTHSPVTCSLSTCLTILISNNWW